MGMRAGIVTPAPWPALAALLVLLAGCASPARPSVLAAAKPTADHSLEYRITLIDPSRKAAEPGLAIAPDGTVFVCSPRGVSKGSDVWVSRDGGSSFAFTGTEIGPAVVHAPLAAPGGGDCDVSAGQAGRAYLADLWVGSVSVSSTTDGEHWTGLPLSQLTPPADRPWILGGPADEVYLDTAQLYGTPTFQGLPATPVGGIIVMRSTDGGMTFPQQVVMVANEDRFAFNGNLALSDGRLYGIYTSAANETTLRIMVSTSDDHGQTWIAHVVAEQRMPEHACFPIVNFPVVAALGDSVVAAWALDNPRTGRVDVFAATSEDRGERWSSPTPLTDRAGSRAFPWVAMSPHGRIVLAWYETNVTARYAPTDPNDRVGTSCEWQGAGIERAEWWVRTAELGPVVRESVVSPQPVHVGPLDRPYAEVMKVAFTPQGKAAMVYVADLPGIGDARAVFAVET